MEHVFVNKHKSLDGIGALIMAFIVIPGVIAMMAYAKTQNPLYGTAALVAMLSIMIARYFMALKYTADYVVNDNAVIFKVKGKDHLVLDYQNYQLSPLIQKQSYLYLFTVRTDRFIEANNGEKTKRYAVSLSKNKFDEFASIVANYSSKREVA